NRIQVFKKDGTFVKEFSIAADTRGNGSVWDLDFSPDGGQTFLYTVDGENNHVAPPPRQRQGADALRAQRPVRGAASLGPQHGGGQEGQHLHDRGLQRQAGAEVRLPGSLSHHHRLTRRISRRVPEHSEREAGRGSSGFVTRSTRTIGAGGVG